MAATIAYWTYFSEVLGSVIPGAATRPGTRRFLLDPRVFSQVPGDILYLERRTHPLSTPDEGQMMVNKGDSCFIRQKEKLRNNMLYAECNTSN